MKKRYCLTCIISVLILSVYPLYMGVRVVWEMLQNGAVISENYPKYLIPYTPISLALLIGALLLPLLKRLTQMRSIIVLSLTSLGVFFIAELLFENMLIITDNANTTLESWQMYMCYMSPAGYATRTWTPVDVLIGDYSPLFKLHFYMISVIIILTGINCMLWFAREAEAPDPQKRKALVLQAISSAIFLGLCVFACFTAFFRTGELYISAVSAILMSAFFVILGVNAAIFAGSFLLTKPKKYAIGVPVALSVIVTLLMYLGETLLLSGNLYRFGRGRFFESCMGLALAPVDILIVCVSGCVSACIFTALTRKAKSRSIK